MIKLEGAKLAKLRLAELKRASESLTPRPTLAIFSVGDDPASNLYVKKKLRLAARAGFQTQHHKLQADCTQSFLLSMLQACSLDESVHGILLQLPLPAHLSATEALLAIHPEKDVDGLHPLNIGRLASGHPLILPCTPKGVITLLDHYHIPIQGKRVVILGRSLIVGLPLSLAMTQRGATVTLCHRDTQDSNSIIASSDITITATGQLDIFPASILKAGSVFIDVGIIRMPDGSVRGDIARADLPNHLKAYTPVPFGIGPMTVISLLENLLTLYKNTYQ